VSKCLVACNEAALLHVGGEMQMQMKSTCDAILDVHAWDSGLYQYLSGEVRLQKGDPFADPTTLNLHANDSLPGTKPAPHGPSE